MTTLPARAPLPRLPQPAEGFGRYAPPPLQQRHGHAVSGHRCIDHPLGGWAKRCPDLCLASIALSALAPAFLLIALFIKLDSAGPIFFRQRRVGFRGRVFRIYKFRTMKTLEDGRNFRQVEREDARITKLGGFLRKSSLDELPQLFNVLLGEMSLVGPRPHALLLEQVLRRHCPQWVLRRIARPGITGLAQVSGERGQTDSADKAARRLACDLDYLRRWNLWLDVRLLARTVQLILKDPKAF